MLEDTFNIKVDKKDTYILQCHAENVENDLDKFNLINVMNKKRTAKQILDKEDDEEDKEEDEDDEDDDEDDEDDEEIEVKAHSPGGVSTSSTSQKMSIKLPLHSLRRTSNEMSKGIDIMVRKMSRLTAHASNLAKFFLARMYEGEDVDAETNPAVIKISSTTLWEWTLKACTYEGLKGGKTRSDCGVDGKYKEILRALKDELYEGVELEKMEGLGTFIDNLKMQMKTEVVNMGEKEM